MHSKRVSVQLENEWQSRNQSHIFIRLLCSSAVNSTKFYVIENNCPVIDEKFTIKRNHLENMVSNQESSNIDDSYNEKHLRVFYFNNCSICHV